MLFLNMLSQCSHPYQCSPSVAIACITCVLPCSAQKAGAGGSKVQGLSRVQSDSEADLGNLMSSCLKM